MNYQGYKKTNYKWHAIFCAMVLSSIVAYLWQINSQAEQSFKIKDLEEKISSLQSEVRAKELEVSYEKSLAKIADRARSLSLTNPENITFIKSVQSTVAVKE